MGMGMGACSWAEGGAASRRRRVMSCPLCMCRVAPAAAVRGCAKCMHNGAPCNLMNKKPKKSEVPAVRLYYVSISAMLNSTGWLSSSREGYCRATSPGAGDCNRSSIGSLRLPADVPSTWEHVAAACLTLCASCRRCHFISASPLWRDCSWFDSSVECSTLRTDIPHFRSAHAHVESGVVHGDGTLSTATMSAAACIVGTLSIATRNQWHWLLQNLASMPELHVCVSTPSVDLTPLGQPLPRRGLSVGCTAFQANLRCTMMCPYYAAGHAAAAAVGVKYRYEGWIAAVHAAALASGNSTIVPCADGLCIQPRPDPAWQCAKPSTANAICPSHPRLAGQWPGERPPAAGADGMAKCRV